jgi:hypothetical protein
MLSQAHELIAGLAVPAPFAIASDERTGGYMPRKRPGASQPSAQIFNRAAQGRIESGSYKSWSVCDQFNKCSFGIGGDLGGQRGMLRPATKEASGNHGPSSLLPDAAIGGVQ